MTPKQERFVAEYLKDFNATQAAIRVGYHPKTAALLIAKPSIRDAIAAAQATHRSSDELTAARVLEEARRIALNDPRGFWTEAGDLKPIGALTAEQASALAGFEVVIKNAKAGDGQTDTVHKIKFWDKGRTLEHLMKHFGLLTERLEHSGGIDLMWKDSE